MLTVKQFLFNHYSLVSAIVLKIKFSICVFLHFKCKFAYKDVLTWLNLIKSTLFIIINSL